MAKQSVMKHLLDENQFDIVAVTESKWDQDHPIIESHNECKWIGNNRVNRLGGRHGFLIRTKTISVNNENLESMNDDWKGYG